MNRTGGSTAWHFLPPRTLLITTIGRIKRTNEIFVLSISFDIGNWLLMDLLNDTSISPSPPAVYLGLNFKTDCRLKRLRHVCDDIVDSNGFRFLLNLLSVITELNNNVVRLDIPRSDSSVRTSGLERGALGSASMWGHWSPAPFCHYCTTPRPTWRQDGPLVNTETVTQSFWWFISYELWLAVLMIVLWYTSHFMMPRSKKKIFF